MDKHGWSVAKEGINYIVFEKKTNINLAGLSDVQMEIVKDAQKLIDEKTATQTRSFGFNTKEGQTMDSSAQKSNCRIRGRTGLAGNRWLCWRIFHLV